MNTATVSSHQEMVIDSTTRIVAIAQGVERDGNVIRTRHDSNRRWASALTMLGIVVVLASPVRSFAQGSDLLPLYGPAELVRALRLPGLSDEIRRPMALHVDRTHGEIFVGDMSSNRILVFDRDGLYRYQFDLADHVSTPQGIVVDSEGFVFVLGTTREGSKVVRFDFDGMYLDEIDLGRHGIRRVSGMTIGVQGQLMLLADDTAVHVISRDGEAIRRIDLVSALANGAAGELIFGLPVVRDGRLFVPASSAGTVLVFDAASGELETKIGIQGNTPGQLTFPTAVDVTSDGIVTVLDRMRFAVVCYAADGTFLGEFGGKGFRDGWFYYPTLLAVSDDDHVIVGQILDGRVQRCRIPRYVRTRFAQANTTHHDDDDDVKGGA